MAKGQKPKVRYNRCMACGICVQACPFSCLELTYVGVDALHKAYPKLRNAESCTGCAICESNCPMECISMQ
jgi:Pyruvate/2-oxoacid:ferredoxin oxidoreductase delta subunit